jgi:hypothetical protein
MAMWPSVRYAALPWVCAPLWCAYIWQTESMGGVENIHHLAWLGVGGLVFI